MPRFTVDLTQNKFLELQRAAFYGATVLDQVMRPAEPVRSQLSDLEWGMAPHPAGAPEPVALRPSIGFSTSTVRGEICCSSGDLDCDPTSQLTDFCSEYQCTIAVT